jgi:uncharacterized protein
MELSLNTVDEGVKNFASTHDSIAAVYLFGSIARGAMRESSDVDLAVMTFSPISPMQRINWETELSNILNKDVDLVIFSQVGCLLQHQILKYGKLIYEKSIQARVRQEVAARREYLDTRFLFKELSV